MAFTLASPAFDDGEDIPTKHTCDGANVSPALNWSDPPLHTRTYALIVDDPDAPAGLWTHWILVNMPGTASALAEGARPSAQAVAGVTSFGKAEYGGPCPPRGHGVHRYFFRLHALSDLMRVTDPLTRETVDDQLRALSLGQAVLMGRYKRT